MLINWKHYLFFIFCKYECLEMNEMHWTYRSTIYWIFSRIFASSRPLYGSIWKTTCQGQKKKNAWDTKGKTMNFKPPSISIIVNIWSGSKKLIKVVLRQERILVWWNFDERFWSTSNVDSIPPSIDICQLHPESKAANYQFLLHCHHSYYVDTTKQLEHLK